MYINWTEKKILGSQIKIGKILKAFLENPKYFRDTGINELCIYFKINKRTLKKYLKYWYKKRKIGNNKNVYINNEIEIAYLKDINKIVNKYKGLLDTNGIKLGQYYLNNLR